MAARVRVPVPALLPFAHALSGLTLLGLFLVASCSLTDPQEQPEPAPVSIGSAGDKYSCPDLDGDTFSPISLCTFQDCNDVLNFARPDLGYCPTYPFLECNPHDGWMTADFALLKAGRRYHVFYIKGPFWQTYPDTHGKAFGHETTLDGLTWEYEGDAFAVDPSSDWDDAFVWSPCVVKKPAEGRYYMFYTGVTWGPYGHEERIGVATSLNLTDWVREPIGNCDGKVSPGCLWEPHLAWNAWSEPGSWTKQCRDPWVYFDEVKDMWYMVYSTAPAPFDWTMVLGLARSADLLEWEDCGPIACTRGGTAESGLLYRMDGAVHLFWTFDSDGGIRHAVSTDPESGVWSAPQVLPGSLEGGQLAAELLEQDGWFVFGYVPDAPRTLHFKLLEFPADGLPQQGPLAGLDCEFVPASGVYPGATEWANGIDDNCNGLVDEGQGPCNDQDGDLYGDPDTRFCARLGWDCDDQDPAVHPGAAGSCDNGIDDNCNGSIDELQECTAKFPSLTVHY